MRVAVLSNNDVSTGSDAPTHGKVSGIEGRARQLSHQMFIIERNLVVTYLGPLIIVFDRE